MNTDLRNLPLSCLRPTQITVGIRYVRVKEVISERNRAQLSAFMLRHPIRVVLGPNDASYIVDHHHWALAWQFMGLASAPVCVVADRREMQEEAFWSLMRKRRWIHPFGPSGEREPLGALPPSLAQLLDDPYQSLAALARRAGAYAKTGSAESSFVWADFLRERILIDDDSDAAFSLALASAIRVARSRSARRLPGFVG